MKLCISSLFEAGGIECVFLDFDPKEGCVKRMPAKAVVVTEMTIEASRAAMRKSRVVANMQDLRLGDIVVSRIGLDGKVIGSIASNGQDAGVSLEIDHRDRKVLLPFTGAHMFRARSVLRAMIGVNRSPGLAATRALTSIEEVLDLARSSPDPDRFPAPILGMAFRSMIVDRFGKVGIDLSDDLLGRYCAANRLRAQIHFSNSLHRDGLGAQTGLEDILSDIGASTGGSRNRRHAGAGNIFSSLLGRPRTKEGVISLPDEALERISSASPDELGAIHLPPGDVELVRERLDSRKIEGAWVNAFKKLLCGSVEGLESITLHQVEGRDVLLVSAEPGGAGLAHSWPTSTRRMVSHFDGDAFLNVSEVEIPEPEEIARLRSSLVAVGVEREEALMMEEY